MDHVTDVKALYEDAKVSKPGHGRWAEVDSEEDRRQTYVLGTTNFGKDTKVEAGTTTFTSSINIPNTPPPHAAKARIQWTLRVKADVAWGQDTRTDRTVRVI